MAARVRVDGSRSARMTIPGFSTCKVHVQGWCGVEPILMDIADHAHDRGPARCWKERAEVYALSDGIKIWPESVSQLFVDQDVAAAIVPLVKPAAIAHWNFH